MRDRKFDLLGPMNFHYSTSIYKTTHRPHTHHSHFNEDAHCDNEVNLILEKTTIIEQKTSESVTDKEQISVVVQQTNPYYFMPIREQTSNSTTSTTSTVVGQSNVLDQSFLLFGPSTTISDLHSHPSTVNLFDESSRYFPSTMNTSDRTSTVNQSHESTFSLSDADLAALFVSSLISTTPSPSTTTNLDHSNEPSAQTTSTTTTTSTTLDDVFYNSANDFSSTPTSTFIENEKTLEPPPGFENFRFEPPSTDELLQSHPTNPSNISNSSNPPSLDAPVSSSDTINFSQLLQSTSVDPLATVAGQVGLLRSSSSSHSSFQSDEQSIFFPLSTVPNTNNGSSTTNNHPYSSSSSSILQAQSQILSTSNANHSLVKPNLPTSLSLKQQHTSPSSRLTSSTTVSPLPKTKFDSETNLNDGELTPNRIFTSPNSFFHNGQTEFIGSVKPPMNKSLSSNIHSNVVARTSSSSASSSTSSSIDEALIQLTQQQQKFPPMNNLFGNEPISSFFPFPSLPTSNESEEQLAVHENIHFLASMATASTPVTPESPWAQTSASSAASNLDANVNLTRKIPSMNQRKAPVTPLKTNTAVIHELMQNLNEICFKGFDELNALIQEQKWVQSYVNLNSTSLPSPNSPTLTLNGSNAGASRVLVVPEYFIFKCKKTEITATHVYDLLSLARPELRLRDLMGAFNSWKESIINAELIHQEEETKLRLSTEHPHSYYMTETVLQAAFDRLGTAIRQLGTMTQQARVAFQYATLNVFQSLSRQQNNGQTSTMFNSLTSSTNSNPSTAQYLSMQQQKSSSASSPSSSSSVCRNNVSLRTTP